MTNKKRVLISIAITIGIILSVIIGFSLLIFLISRFTDIAIIISFILIGVGMFGLIYSAVYQAVKKRM